MSADKPFHAHISHDRKPDHDHRGRAHGALLQGQGAATLREGNLQERALPATGGLSVPRYGIATAVARRACSCSGYQANDYLRERVLSTKKGTRASRMDARYFLS